MPDAPRLIIVEFPLSPCLRRPNAPSEDLDRRFQADTQDDEPVSENCVGQFGALCYRRTETGVTEILLITTRETKRWTIPKGWPVDGRKPHQVAEQEAWEEAGVVGYAKKRPYGSYVYLKRLYAGDRVQAVVDVNVLEVKRTRRRFPERGERRMAWFSAEEAARMVEEPRLQKLIRRLGNSSQTTRSGGSFLIDGGWRP